MDNFIRKQLKRMQISPNSKCIAEQIATYQLAQFIDVLKYAKTHSLFYRKLYNDLDLYAIKTMADIKKIPAIFESDLQKNSTDMLCLPDTAVARSLYTSGTIKQKQIFMSATDIEQTIDYFKTGIQRVANNNDKILVLYPHKSYGSIGQLLSEACSSLGLKNISAWPVDLLENFTNYKDQYFPQLAKNLALEDISMLISPVGMSLDLARAIKDLPQIDCPKIQKLLLSSEYLSETDKTLLYDVFSHKNEGNGKSSLQIFEHYATAESGYGIALDCGRDTGCYCNRDADILVEEIDGKLAITTLHREAMPLIRYVCGDESSIIQTRCPFDSPLTRLKRVGNRAYKKGLYVY